MTSPHATTRSFRAADGSIRTWTEREWRTASTRCRIKTNPRLRYQRTAEVVINLVVGDGSGRDWVELAATWYRDPPPAKNEIARRWYYHDPDGGRWSVEYGYDGRFWLLFGPAMTPDGYMLARTIAGSLTEATEYIARNIARARDANQVEGTEGGAWEVITNTSAIFYGSVFNDDSPGYTVGYIVPAGTGAARIQAPVLPGQTRLGLMDADDTIHIPTNNDAAAWEQGLRGCIADSGRWIIAGPVESNGDIVRAEIRKGGPNQ